jgi:hypothetical protein
VEKIIIAGNQLLVAGFACLAMAQFPREQWRSRKEHFSPFPTTSRKCKAFAG